MMSALRCRHEGLQRGLVGRTAQAVGPPCRSSGVTRFVRLATPVIALCSVLAVPATTHAATSLSVTWALPAGLYSVGVDHLAPGGTSAPGYEQHYEYPYSVYNNNPVLPNPLVVSSSQTLSQVRVEWYARHPGLAYDARSGDGAVTTRIDPPFGARNVGTLVFPQVGGANTGRLHGAVRSRTTVTNGRVRVEIFQVTGQRTTNKGAVLDAFSASNSVGSEYLTGPLWTGSYIAFVTDTTTGAQAIGFIDIAGDTTFDLDLDTICFGIDECQWSGATSNVGGKFHPVSPARIVDTRLGQGVPRAITPGDGRNSDPNSNNRLSSRLGHEFRITGVGGVPTTGVSAVLLNVTVTGGTAACSMRLIPKPPRSAAWVDQSSYPTANTQMAGVHWGAGETRASLQLVKVGVGGRVRLDSLSWGSVHLVVDVAGWVDESQPGQGGDRLLTVDPARLLDTRDGTGGPVEPVAGGEERPLTVAGISGVPADADAVLGNLTSVNTAGPTYLSVWPGGQAPRTVSVLNSVAGEARSNLVCVGVGDAADWVLFNGVRTTALAFDAMGYATAAPGTGGVVTALPSFDLMNPTALGPAAQFYVPVVGRGGVPATGVSAVWVVVTVKSPSTGGYLAVYPNSGTVPETSNLNWAAGRSVASLALVPLGIGGAIRLYHHVGTSTVSVAVLGWVS